MSRLLDEIRQAIDDSGESRYQIAQRSGVSQSGLSRLMSGERGLSVEAVERVADALGLEIVLRARQRSRKRSR